MHLRFIGPREALFMQANLLRGQVGRGGPWKPVLRIRIHLFLGLLDPDPDPLVRGMDPDPDPALDPDPSIIMQKIVRKTLIPTI